MSSIVVLGVFNADAVFRANRLPAPGETIMGEGFELCAGGKGSNQAIAAARLGGDVTFITAIGRDAFGDLGQQVWKDAAVRPVVIAKGDRPTGAAMVIVNSRTGENAIVVSPGAAHGLTAEDIDKQQALIAGADVFLTQLEQPIDAARRGLEIARRAGVRTILNPAPACPLPDSMLDLCDFLTPNRAETLALTGIDVTDARSAAAAARGLKTRGVSRPIITLGAAGVYVENHGIVPARRVSPVRDTTGAGDAFSGAFAYGLASGLSVVAAAELAVSAAALSVMRSGAAKAMPSLAELARFHGKIAP